MKYIFWISMLFVTIISIMYFVSRNNYQNTLLKNDSIQLVNKRLDSSYKILSNKRDSIIFFKDSVIKKINIYHEKEINRINHLNVDEQINLLSNNLSE